MMRWQQDYRVCPKRVLCTRILLSCRRDDDVFTAFESCRKSMSNPYCTASLYRSQVATRSVHGDDVDTRCQNWRGVEVPTGGCDVVMFIFPFLGRATRIQSFVAVDGTSLFSHNPKQCHRRNGHSSMVTGDRWYCATICTCTSQFPCLLICRPGCGNTQATDRPQAQAQARLNRQLHYGDGSDTSACASKQETEGKGTFS